MSRHRLCRRLRAVLLIAVLVTAVRPSLSQDPARATLERGQQLILEKQLDQAIALFAELKTSQSTDPRPYFFTGLALQEQGKLTEAAAELREAVALGAQTPQYRLAYVDVLLRSGDRNEARQQIQGLRSQALADSSLDNSELWLLSNLFYRLADYSQALTTLQTLAQRTPESVQVLQRIGQLYLMLESYEDAAETFSKARNQSPELASAHYGEGVALWRLGRASDALNAFQSAVDLKPEERDYLFNLAAAMLEMKRPAEALVHLKKLETIGGDLVQVYRGLANAYNQLGDAKQSRAYAARVPGMQTVEKDPGALEAAVDSLEAGRVAEARELFLKVLEEDPESTGAHSYLARIYLSSRLWTSARQHLDVLMRLQPEAFETHFLFSDFWYQQGNFIEARRFGEKAKALRPDFASGRNLLGNIYMAAGQRAQARQEYQAAIDLDPESEIYRQNLKSAQ